MDEAPSKVAVTAYAGDDISDITDYLDVWPVGEIRSDKTAREPLVPETYLPLVLVTLYPDSDDLLHDETHNHLNIIEIRNASISRFPESDLDKVAEIYDPLFAVETGDRRILTAVTNTEYESVLGDIELLSGLNATNYTRWISRANEYIIVHRKENIVLDYHIGDDAEIMPNKLNGKRNSSEELLAFIPSALLAIILLLQQSASYTISAMQFNVAAIVIFLILLASLLITDLRGEQING